MATQAKKAKSARGQETWLTSNARTVEFDGRQFEIRPTWERDPEFAYDDGADFILEALPIILKYLKIRGDDALESGDFNEYDIIGLAREVKDTLPYLAAMACWTTDRSVTAEDIKRWTRRPLHPEMIKAVVWQIQADDIMSQIAGANFAAQELGSAAQTTTQDESAGSVGS